MKKIRVWDLPLRLFHWLLALLVVAAVVTQKIGGNAMLWHFRIGYCVLALLLFRMIWGLVGPRYARFVDFLRGPVPILDYLKGSGRNYPGHNPLGSLSVVALLGFLLFQVVTGLFSNDDIASEGPLVKFISKEVSDQATWLHKELGATVIYILVGVHVAAILWYTHLRKEKLVKAMVTGDKEVDYVAEPAQDGVVIRLAAVLVLAVAAFTVWWLVNL